MDKVIRDGKVAVLYSPGYGAGWYSWNLKYPELVFHPRLVQWVEGGKKDPIDEIVKEIIGEESEEIYCGGAKKLTIEWVPQGTVFDIEVFDGSERIRYIAMPGSALIA